ncbi:MAG: RNA polymerase sigma factor [Ignavibacteria bacterium]|nr:RNA polymerase sigma factor [Ignavibacteria bacterium]
MAERDLKRFPELYMPLHNSALRYCRSLIAGNPNFEAEELLQQSLQIALENFSKLRDEEKFKFWFFKIITRAFYAYSRKNFWKKHTTLDIGKEYKGYSEFPKVYEDEENDENRMILLKALSKIKKRDRSAFILYAIEDFTLEDIKKVQNEISVSTVKSRIYRTRTKLQTFIINYNNNEVIYEKAADRENLKLLGEIENEVFK